MIDVTLQPLPDVHCGEPFHIRACVITDVPGPVRICASLANGTPCHLGGHEATPGHENDHCVTVHATGDTSTEQCADIFLVAECPGHDGSMVIGLTVTATNAAKEHASDSRGLHITCP